MKDLILVAYLIRYGTEDFLATVAGSLQYAAHEHGVSDLAGRQMVDAAAAIYQHLNKIRKERA